MNYAVIYYIVLYFEKFGIYNHHGHILYYTMLLNKYSIHNKILCGSGDGDGELDFDYPTILCSNLSMLNTNLPKQFKHTMVIN